MKDENQEYALLNVKHSVQRLYGAVQSGGILVSYGLKFCQLGFGC